jgi:hypothetical protein
VVLHLVAEVAACDVEQRASLDVRGADQLAHVPAPRVSPSTSFSVNVYVWSGKWPQKMIAYDQTLRTTFATTFAVRVV